MTERCTRICEWNNGVRAAIHALTGCHTVPVSVGSIRPDAQWLHVSPANGTHEAPAAAAVQHLPFANLPEKKSGRWGQGLTASKMKECLWLRPLLVGQFEFVEWTADLHLRHTRFLALREDKKAKDVRRETID